MIKQSYVYWMLKYKNQILKESKYTRMSYRI